MKIRFNNILKISVLLITIFLFPRESNSSETISENNSENLINKMQFITYFDDNSEFLQDDSMQNPFYEDKIGNIYLEKKELYDTNTKYPIVNFVLKILNAIHINTKDYVVKNEILFYPGDTVDELLLEETERNLRNLGIFSSVVVQLDSNNDVDIITQDSWSLKPSILLDIGGSEKSIGGRLNETNLFGTNTNISAEAVYRTRNDTKWGYGFSIQNNRIFKFGLGAKYAIYSDKYNFSQNIGLFKNFNHLNDKYAGGVFADVNRGERYIYTHLTDFDKERTLRNFEEENYFAYFARAWKGIDRIFFSTSIDINKTSREAHKIAYDNMGKFLLAFSSSSEEWVKLTRINSFIVEDVPIGGWGSAVIGRVFPMQNAEMPPMFYVAGSAERSYLSLDNKFYLFGQINASTSFSEAAPRFTYQEFQALSFYSFSPKFLIGGRLRQQTIWNWGFYHRQLMLDNSTGLRGYKIDNLVGDNRLVTNIEFRWMPDIPFWIFNIGFNAFWDAGTVWRRGVGFFKTRWHHSAGIGIRFYNESGDINSNAFRFDFAYNFDQMKFAEVIFSTNQFFSFFSSHAYVIPKVLGIDIDY